MAYLVLNNKAVFEGRRMGAKGTGLGELVFTTGMEGYLETLTDPSYAGQIIVQTFPLIGNYGVIPSDFEGKPYVSGYVVRELCEAPSNFRSEYELDTFLKNNNICGISGVDTRAITKIIRSEGTMNAMICDTLPKDFSQLDRYRLQNCVKTVSRKNIEVFEPKGKAGYNIALVDYGAKRNIINSLTERGCRVTAFPHDTSAEKILEIAPNGIMLSNGPGDPAENTYCIEQIKKLLGKIPVFGICLGHQLAALAMGGKTQKLKFGHRGANQPVTDLKTNRTYITSQNHSYAVVSDSIGKNGEMLFINANDQSCEGIIYPNLNCLTVQFHPEAAAGPRNTAFLFDRFLEMC